MSNQKGDKKVGDFEYNQRTAKGVLKDHDLSSEEALVGEAKNYDDNDDQFLNRKELTAAAEDDIAEYAPQEDDSDVPCSECGEMIAPTSSICPECKHSFN